jgi:hypothetical protein
MRDFNTLLTAVGAIGLLIFGFRNRKIWDIRCGGCFLGIALFGYLAGVNEQYS